MNRLSAKETAAVTDGIFRRAVCMLLTVVSVFTFALFGGGADYECITADAAVSIGKVTMKAEAKYGNDSTHPFNYQTSRITLNWNAAKNATRYQIFIKGGDYKSWTRVRTVFATETSVTIKNLKRNTSYQFKVRGTIDDKKGEFSSVQTIKTARIDFDWEGWQAMCRIVYHEVGQIDDSMWNEPIVHVADCVVNRYEAAKYTNDKTWSSYYKKYSTIQDVIYKSGNFMSSSALTKSGATYSKCRQVVKLAVYGAVYNKVTVDDIKHSTKVYYWSNTSKKPTSKKVAYTYKIPWGYFNIWSEYWG